MMFIVLLLCVSLLILVALCAGKSPGSRGRKLPPGKTFARWMQGRGSEH